MSLKPPSRRRLVVLLSIVLLAGAACNMPGIAPGPVDLFTTVSPVGFEALVIELTGAPGAASPQGVQAPQETQPPLMGALTSTPPPTVTPSGPGCVVPPVTPGEGQALVGVYFHCRGELMALPRVVPEGASASKAQAAMQALLAGPTDAERSQGFVSWFSSQTAGSLRSLSSGVDGQAQVDLEDFSGRIANASSSAGSKMLVDQLSATLFQFPEYQSILFMFEGDCNRFWTWLQSSCILVQRAP